MRLQKIVMREARRRNLRGIGAASGGYRPEYNRAPAGEKAFAPLEGRFKVHGA